MLVLEILGGWFLLSCLAAPLIGRFVATHATVAEDPPLAAEPLLQPARSF
jgi:hypothetical protein